MLGSVARLSEGIPSSPPGLGRECVLTSAPPPHAPRERRLQGGFGDLWVTYKVAFPTKLSAADKDVLKKVLGSASWHDEL